MKKLLILLAAVSLLLAGCVKKDSGNNTPAPPPSVEVGTDIGAPEDDLDFELSQGGNPNFDDSDLSNEETPTEPIYIEVGDYVYRVDPVTLQPVGEPLDPETLEPIDTSSIPEEGADEEEPGDTPTTEEPTDENKYPNTGMYEGDD